MRRSPVGHAADGLTQSAIGCGRTARRLLVTRARPDRLQQDRTSRIRRRPDGRHNILFAPEALDPLAAGFDHLAALMALLRRPPTASGVQWTEGGNWARDDDSLPVDQLLDIALTAGVLYLLLAGGRLWSRPL